MKAARHAWALVHWDPPTLSPGWRGWWISTGQHPSVTSRFHDNHKTRRHLKQGCLLNVSEGHWKACLTEYVGNLAHDTSNMQGPGPNNAAGSAKHMHYWKTPEILTQPWFVLIIKHPSLLSADAGIAGRAWPSDLCSLFLYITYHIYIYTLYAYYLYIYTYIHAYIYTCVISPWRAIPAPIWKEIRPGWKEKFRPGRKEKIRPGQKQKIRPNIFNIFNNMFHICSNAFSTPLTYILKLILAQHCQRPHKPNAAFYASF